MGLRGAVLVVIVQRGVEKHRVVRAAVCCVSRRVYVADLASAASSASFMQIYERRPTSLIVLQGSSSFALVRRRAGMDDSCEAQDHMVSTDSRASDF